MKINSVKLSNFFQHKNLYVKFSHGLNCITGRNGVGKSNLVNSIAIALTGDYTRFVSNKCDIINQLSFGDEPCFVELEAEHESEKFTILRSIRPNKTVLKIRDKTIEKNKEVNGILFKLLDTNSTIINNYMFVRQWEIFKILSESPTERAKSLQKLFNLDNLDKIYKTVNSFNLFHIPSKIDFDQLITMIKKAKAEILDIEKQLESLSEFENWVISEDPDYIYKEKYEENKKLLDQISEIDKEKSIKNQEIHKLSENKKQLLDSLSKIKSEIDLLPKLDNLIKYKSDIQKINKIKNDINEIQKIIKHKKSEIKSLIDKIKKTKYIINENKKVMNELVENRAIINYKKETITKLNYGFINETELSICPICHSDVRKIYNKSEWQKVFDSKNELFKNELELIDNNIKQKAVEKDTIHNYINEVKHLSKQKSKLKSDLMSNEISRINSLKNELLYLNDTIRSYNLTIDLSETEKLITKTSFLVEKYTNIENKIREIERNIQNFNDSMNYLSKLKEQIYKNKINSDYLDNSVYIKSNKAITEKTKKKLEYDKLKYKLEFIKQGLEEKTQLLSTWQKTINDENIAIAVKNKIEQIKNIFHPSALPAYISRKYLLAMKEIINENLKLFKPDFYLKNIEDLDFIIKFDNGIEISANRLSGGQKVIFSVAFRLALHDLFSKSLGVMCLDEPSVGLDNDNKKYIEEIFYKMKELSNKSKTQIIVVTHDQIAIDIFDVIIDFDSR